MATLGHLPTIAVAQEAISERIFQGQTLNVHLSERRFRFEHNFQITGRSYVALVLEKPSGTENSDRDALSHVGVAVENKILGSIPDQELDRSDRSDDQKVILYLLPPGDFKLVITLEKDAQDRYWIPQIDFGVRVLYAIPARFDKSVATFADQLPTLSVESALIDLIDYRSPQGRALSARDKELAVRLIPAVANSFSLMEATAKAPSDLEKSASNPSDEIFKAYRDLFDGSNAEESPPYYKPADWSAKFGVPQIVLLMPPIQGHEELKRLNWANAIESFASEYRVKPQDVAVMFMGGCEYTTVIYLSKRLVNVDYFFACAMTMSRSEPLNGEIDLSLAVPSFLGHFLPQDTQFQFDRSSAWNTEVTIKGLRGIVIPGGNAWERVELIFNLEDDKDKPDTVFAQIIADGSLAYAIGSYPPDSQFTTPIDNGDLQTFVRRLTFEFEKFVKENDLEVGGGRLK